MKIFSKEDEEEIQISKINISAHLELLIQIEESECFLGNDLVKCLNQITEKLKRVGFASENKILEITLRIHPKVEQIDIFIFNALAVFKTVIPNLNFIFEFENIAQSESNDLFHDNSYSIYKSVFYKTVQHIGIYSFLTNKELAKMKIDNEIFGFFDKYIGSNTQEKRERLLKPLKSVDSWINISDSYLPIIKITPESFNFYFSKQTTLNIDSLINEKDFQYYSNAGKDNSDNVYQNIRRNLLFIQNDNNSCRLVYLYYLSLLKKCRYIQKECSQSNLGKLKDLKIVNSDSKFKWRNCTDINYNDYLKKASILFDEVKIQEPYFIYLFSILAGIRVSELELSEDQLIHIEVLKILNATKTQCYSICAGIKELASNIVEHTSNKQGFICARLFNKHDLLNIKSFAIPQVSESLVNIKDSDYYLDISVIDVSEIGILESYRKTIERKIGFSKNNDVVADLNNQMELIGKSKSLSQLYDKDVLRNTHQVTRAIASLGLQIFNKKVQQFSGLFFVSTLANESTLEYLSTSEPTISPIYSTEGLYTQGSYYNIILPTKYESEKIDFVNVEKLKEKSEIVLDPLLAFEYDNPFGFIFFDKPYRLKQFNTNGYDHEKYSAQKEIVSFYIRENEDCISKNQLLIPVLNYEKLFLNPSQLVRIIASLQFLNNISNLICINITKSQEREVFDIIESFADTNGKFWSNSKNVLFLIQEKKNLIERKILTGDNKKDCENINEYLNQDDKLFTPNDFNFNQCPFFDSNLRLVEFELIIYLDNKTIFEHEVLQVLNMNVAEGGYKVDNTHFKLGSKIHINTFYYAERLFQNSYYCNRFAFLLMCRIAANPEFNDNNNKKWTFIGYGEYSDLLLSKVVSLLQFVAQEKDINFSLVNDVQSMRFLDNTKLFENLLIVVPISTTFSTSIKIEEFLKSKDQNNRLKIQPEAYSILVVSDGELESNERRSAFNDKNDICRRFNWIDLGDVYKRSIKITTNESTSDIRYQSYFIALNSSWYAIEKCPLCFYELSTDNIPQNEKPLIRTDPTSVTPDLIFGPPTNVNVQTSNETGISLFNGKNHCFGHFEINENHFVHYIHRNVFFENNTEKILAWLRKEKEVLPESMKNAKAVIIISPGHNTTSHFLTKVNEILFSDIATAIKHKASNNFIENFMFFHQKIIAESEFVFYVDDIIGSGKTLKSISDHVKLVRKGKGLDGVFTLIDRTSSHEHDEIKLSLNDFEFIENNCIEKQKWYRSFFKLNVYSIDASHKGCPVCERNLFFEGIEKSSQLDALKLLFFKKRKAYISQYPLEHSISVIKYDPFINDRINPYSKEFYARFDSDFHKWLNKDFEYDRNLIKLLVSHTLSSLNYDYIESDGFNIRTIIDDIKSDDNLSSYFRGMNLKSSEISFVYRSELKEVLEEIVIKVLTRPPFILHKPILEAVFKYIIDELERFRETHTLDHGLSFKDFKLLKFLLKRSVLLSSNYLLSKNVLMYLRKVILNSKNDAIDINKSKLKFYQDLLSQEQNVLRKNYLAQCVDNFEYRVAKIGEFHYFLLSLVKELVWGNEPKSIFLEQSLNSIDASPQISLKEFSTDDYYFLWRVLKSENTSILNSFIKMHESNTFGHKENSKEKYLDVYRGRYFNNSDYRLNAVNEFLIKSTNSDESKDELEKSLSHTLYLCDILELENSRSDSHLAQESPVSQQKRLNSDIKKYLDVILKILDPNIEFGLSFIFSIEYKRTNNLSHPLSNIYTMVYNGIYDDDVTEQVLSKDGFIVKMLHGLSITEQGSPQTYVGMVKDGDDYYSFRNEYFYSRHSIYHVNGIGEQNKINPKESIRFDSDNIQVIKNASQLLFFRLADISEVDKEDRTDEGQAVLCVCYRNRPQIISSHTLFHPTRTRLLLLVKEKLLSYLNKQFSNDAFIEVLQDRAIIDYSTSMEHGLSTYFKAIKAVISSVNADDNPTKSKLVFLEFLNETISTHINTKRKILTDVNFDLSKHTDNITKEAFVELMRLIFEQTALANKRVPLIEGINFFITFESTVSIIDVIYKQIIPELFYNMKKYSDIEGTYTISIVEGKFLQMKNSKQTKAIMDEEVPSNGMGIDMCNNILTSLCKFPQLDIKDEPNYYTVTIQINE